jgi:hypothetical protein
MDRRTQQRNASASAADSLWRHAAEQQAAKEPVRHPSGLWSCCGGFGEHFARCQFATWEARER